jgi:hypothetical protein
MGQLLELEFEDMQDIEGQETQLNKESRGSSFSAESTDFFLDILSHLLTLVTCTLHSTIHSNDSD